MIYVDSGPLAEGGCVNDELPVVDGEVPLPDWSDFEEADLIDLTDELREHFRAIAIPEPARVTSDPIHLTDPRRYDGARPPSSAASSAPSRCVSWMEGGVRVRAHR